MSRDKEKQRKWQREHLARIRAEWLEANGPCSKCGSSEQLEVDHINPELKISHNVWSWKAERRAAELAKCQVLCNTCHKKKTAADRMPSHGTDSRYTHYRCKCEPCLAAHRIANARRRERARGVGARNRTA